MARQHLDPRAYRKGIAQIGCAGPALAVDQRIRVADGDLHPADAADAPAAQTLEREAVMTVEGGRQLGRDDRLVTYQDAEPFTTRDKRLSIAKAARVLGHAPRVSLEDGLARTLAWMKCVYLEGAAANPVSFLEGDPGAPSRESQR